MAKRPPKKNPIRTNPVSLNESTLESNIASEIAILFNSTFNFGYPSRLRWLFGFNRININQLQKRKTKLFRLTPIEENRGGGWDTKISIPKGQNDERAIFIQFKSGTHSDGNDIANSIFNKTIKTPNPHAEFSFNDNKSKNPANSNNQHQTLKNLSDHLVAKGISSKSVMYGFPRITKIEDFAKLEDDLILHTTFLTLEEIDNEAKNAGINLYDRKKHHFRTCYLAENKREIASEVFEMKNSSEHIDVLYEIFLVKMSRFRNQFSKRVSVDDSNDQIFLMLAEYLKIDILDSLDLSKYYPEPIIAEFKKYFSQLYIDNESNFYEIFKREDFNTNPFEWKKQLYYRLSEFFKSNTNSINIQSIPSKYTFNLDNEKEIDLYFEIDTDVNLLVF